MDISTVQPSDITDESKVAELFEALYQERIIWDPICDKAGDIMEYNIPGVPYFADEDVIRLTMVVAVANAVCRGSALGVARRVYNSHEDSAGKLDDVIGGRI